MSLIERIDWAHENLAPVTPKYAIVWFDPLDEDEVAKVTRPAPEWLAAALHGGIVPTAEACQRIVWKMDDVTFIGSKADADDWCRRNRRPVSIEDYSMIHGAVAPAMTEEQFMEYLVMTTLPTRVWADRETNRRRFVICPADKIPQDRRFRAAWRLNHG